jgi:hypothetical protein
VSEETKRFTQLVVATLIGTYAIFGVYRAYEGFIHRANYLYWDPAAHAYYGVKLTAAVESLNPLRIISVLNEQVLWPPLHSILQLPFMVVIGKSFLASSICSMVFLGLFFVLLTFCYQQVSTSWLGLAVLLIFVSTSPITLGFGSMPMLEVFGGAFTALSAGLYLRSSRWFPLSLTLLFFLKYNYFVYLFMPFTALEYGPYLIQQFKSKKFRILKGLSRFQIFLILYLFLLLTILLTGGFKLGSLSVRGIGNPAYVLYLLLLAKIAITKEYKKIWSKLKGTGWEWFVIPVGIWLLVPIPNRVKTLVSFGINVPLSGHSPKELSYYSFYLENLQGYFASAIVLIICAVMALTTLIIYCKDKKILFLAGLFILPLLLMTINQNKQDRYLYTFVFTLWILAAILIGKLSSLILRSFFAISLCTLMAFYYDYRDTTKVIAWPFIPACLDEPIHQIAKSVVNEKKIVMLGVSNDLSPSVIMFHIQYEQLFKNRTQFGWKLNDLEPGSRLIVLEGREAAIPSLPPAIRLKFLNKVNFNNCLKVTSYSVE